MKTSATLYQTIRASQKRGFKICVILLFLSTLPGWQQLLAQGLGIGVSSPTSVLHLQAGTSAAGTAPLKFNSGVNLTTPEAGAVEYDGSRLFYTTSTPARITLLGHDLGLAGGTTLIGGTAASENLTLFSTSHATKGKILFGTSGYDEVNNRLGVGTNTPSVMLHVKDAGTPELRIGSSAANGDASLTFMEDDGTTNAGVGLYYIGGSNELRFREIGGADIMTIERAGNVGIGTSAPTQKLEVIGDAGFYSNAADAEGMKIQTEYVNGNSSGRIYWNERQDDVYGFSMVFAGNANPTFGGTAFTLPTNNFYLLRHENSATGSVAMAVARTTGYVGIGTSAPVSQLHVDGGTADTWINVNASEAGNYNSGVFLREGQASGNTRGFKLYYNSFDFYIDYNDGGADATSLFIERTNGNIGIGTTSATNKLNVENAATVASFNRTSTDGTVISIRQDGSEEGTISVSGTTVSYNAFTGSHYACMEQEAEKGILVTLTGKNEYAHNNKEAEIIYGVEKSSQPNDPKIMGAFLGPQESSLPYSIENPYLVMAVGNGVMWVVDKGEDIEIGDYLISSDVVGHAMKDNGTYATAFVVARVAEPVNWNEETMLINGVKHKLVSVFFESFIRNNAEEKLIKMEEKVQLLENKLNVLETKMSSLYGEAMKSGK